MKDFNFFVPLVADEEAINKAQQAQGDARYDNMIVHGMASDSSTDTDEEEMLPEGFDVKRFLKSGLINYEHQVKKDPKSVIGEPFEAYVKSGKFFIKAKLYKASQLAKDLWDTIIAMKESGSKRLPGWSIEGKALERDFYKPKRVTKALITHCALTFTPKNANTWADIVKGEQAEDYVIPEFDLETANGGKTYLLEMQGSDGSTIRVNKDFSITIIRKAMSAGAATGMQLVGQVTSGASLKKESVDKKLKYLQPQFTKSLAVVAKAIESGELNVELLKGGKPAEIGEIREFAGKRYQKTVKGWRPVKKSEQTIKHNSGDHPDSQYEREKRMNEEQKKRQPKEKKDALQTVFEKLQAKDDIVYAKLGEYGIDEMVWADHTEHPGERTLSKIVNGLWEKVTRNSPFLSDEERKLVIEWEEGDKEWIKFNEEAQGVKTQTPFYKAIITVYQNKNLFSDKEWENVKKYLQNRLV
jgi:hypothetical protein